MKALLFIAGLALTGCFNFVEAQRKIDRERLAAQGDITESVSAEAWRAAPQALPRSVSSEQRAVRANEVGAPLIVLDDERVITHTWLEPPAQVRYRQHLYAPKTWTDIRRVALIQSRTAADAAAVELTVPPGAVISNFQARTITADGRLIDVDEPVLFPVIERPGEPPLERLVFAFPHAEPGAVVAWRVRFVQDGYKPQDQYFVPPVVPVRRARYRFRTYKFVTERALAHGMTHADSTTERRRTRVWTATDLPFEPPEPGMTVHPLGRASVQFAVDTVDGYSMITDWAVVLRALHNQMQSMYTTIPASWYQRPRPTGDLAQAALDIVRAELMTGTTPLGYRKESLATLHRFRRGNTDQQALAITALMHHWKQSCELAITTPAGTPPILRNFPSPPVSPNVLVACPMGLYIDPLCAGCPAGRLSQAHQGRGALRLGNPSSRNPTPTFIRLPVQPTTDASRTFEVEVNARGLIAREGTVTLHGEAAAGIRAWFAAHPLPEARRAKAAKERFLDGIEAERLGIAGLDTADGPIEFKMQGILLSRNGLVRTQDWVKFAIPAAFGESLFGLLSVTDRQRPAELEASDGFHNTLIVKPPEGMAITRAPAAKRVDGPFGEYALTAKTEGGALELVERMVVRPQIVTPADWPKLRAFLEAASAARQAPIVFGRTP